MRTDVATLASDDTIETALALFSESAISGAPVVANERLVGVLTLADVSRPEHMKGGALETRGEYQLSEPVGEELADEVEPEETFFSKDDYSPEVLGRQLVGDWMSSGVVTVPPDASLEQVCRRMVEHRIHRVFVTEREKLVGVISSFDVVRHVARGAGRTRRPGPP